jgi:copper(I)-binding protein
MLFGVKAPFVETQRVPLRVRFEKAGWIDVDVVVGPVDPGADHSMHRHH